jgi:hypothetical protein
MKKALPRPNFHNERINAFLKKKKDEIEVMEGKRGVVALRKQYEKLYTEARRIETTHIRNQEIRSSMFNPEKGTRKSLHKKGIKPDPQFAFLERIANKIIKEGWRATYVRGEYNEICYPDIYYQLGENRSYMIPERLANIWKEPFVKASKCIKDIEHQGFDEHGGWIRGGSLDKHGRGEFINVDIYGMDNENDLYVVQVRQYRKTSKNGYPRVLKNYFLCGYNENKNPFAHSIPSRTVHAAIQKDDSVESPVRAAQAWIWGIKQDQLPQVLRNGDVALIPTKKSFKKGVQPVEKGMFRAVDSHWVYCQKKYENGSLYAFNPTLRHMKGQHPTQKGTGWYKVVVGNRARFHDFAAPTAD